VDTTFSLSFFDRLILDASARERSSVIPGREEALRVLKAAVKRDLESLLNTRQPVVDIPQGLKEVQRSILRFGLPDFTRERSPDVIAGAIEKTILAFEMRLESVRVVPDRSVRADKKDAPHLTGSMKFKIVAKLRARPISQPVEYDTVIELTSGRCEIGGQGMEPLGG
jgi:type VI secretion system protein ImpF